MSTTYEKSTRMPGTTVVADSPQFMYATHHQTSALVSVLEVYRSHVAGPGSPWHRPVDAVLDQHCHEMVSVSFAEDDSMMGMEAEIERYTLHAVCPGGEHQCRALALR